MLRIGAFFGGMAIAACGSDKLAERFIPDKDKDNGKFGPALPITPADYSFALAATYNRTSDSGRGRGTVGEAQSSGTMCVRISSVTDTETTAGESADQSSVGASVKIAGGVANSDLIFSDQTDNLATGTDVDALLSPLWLKQLTVPSETHGYATAQSVKFATRFGARPLTDGETTTDPLMSRLLFFDIRTLEKQDWAGWAPNGDLPDATSYIENLLIIFSDIQADATQLRPVNPIAASDTCDTHTELSTCNSAIGCAWTSPLAGGSSTCLPSFAVSLTWRETLAAPSEIAGPVIRQMDLLFNEVGILRSADERICPDENITAPLLPLTTGTCGFPTLSARVRNLGPWLPSSACAF